MLPAIFAVEDVQMHPTTSSNPDGNLSGEDSVPDSAARGRAARGRGGYGAGAGGGREPPLPRKPSTEDEQLEAGLEEV